MQKLLEQISVHNVCKLQQSSKLAYYHSINELKANRMHCVYSWLADASVSLLSIGRWQQQRNTNMTSCNSHWQIGITVAVNSCLSPL